MDVSMNGNVVCPAVARSQAKVGIEPLPDLDDSLCVCVTRKGLESLDARDLLKKEKN